MSRSPPRRAFQSELLISLGRSYLNSRRMGRTKVLARKSGSSRGRYTPPGSWPRSYAIWLLVPLPRAAHMWISKLVAPISSSPSRILVVISSEAS